MRFKMAVLDVLVFLIFINCNAQPNKEVEKNAMDPQEIRKAVVAGTWYSSNPEKLRKEIASYLENAKKAEIRGEIIALISPHAGYAYSGAVASHAYKQVMGNHYDAVIVIAPSHREAFHGVSVFNKDGYETPLGVVPVAKEIADALIAQSEHIRFSWEGHREEHALEIQLPFLQLAIPDLKIVPIVFWDHSWDNCTRLADAIVHAVKDKNVLIVASSDLYHGYDYEECVRSDNRTLETVVELNTKKLYQAFQHEDAMACGAGGILVAEMVAIRLGATQATRLFQTNSGDVTGNRNDYVVGYGAVAIYRADATIKEERVGMESGLTGEEKQYLLKLARQTIEKVVDRKKPPKLKHAYPVLKEKRGAFVTLTKNGMLRGCIGYVTAVLPLDETIVEMAQAAAFRDPRFPAVTKDEVAHLEIEISVLTPIREIADIREIEIGKHGIIIERGSHSGLLLPQVATEYGWNRETFLDHTCTKAGLSSDAWQKDGTRIKIFSADIFHEE